MNARRVFLLLAAATLCSGAGSVRADRTNVWPFTNPVDYDLSDSGDIEVTGGVARLNLLATQVLHAEIEDYLRPGAVCDGVHAGPAASVGLTSRAGRIPPAGSSGRGSSTAEA